MTIKSFDKLPLAAGVREADLSTYVPKRAYNEHVSRRVAQSAEEQRNAARLATWLALRAKSCGVLHANDEYLVCELLDKVGGFKWTLIDEIKVFGTTLEKLIATPDGAHP